MKKLLLIPIFCFAIFASTNLSGDFVWAQGEGIEDTVFTGGGLEEGLDILRPLLDDTGIGNEGGLITAILFWVRILLILSGVLAFVAFVWAGFLLITHFASEENTDKAKKVVLYAAVGIIVILFSYVLTNFFITANI